MLPCRIVKDADEVEARLKEKFGVGRQDIIRIALTALGARNDSIAFDPRFTKGMLAYIYGVRALREVFVLQAKYEPRSHYNIESVYSDSRGLKIMFQSADSACDEKVNPSAISEIGAAKQIFIERSAEGFLFPEMEKEEDERISKLTAFDKAEAWYIIVCFTNDSILCEISHPKGVVGQQFSGFFERIFIINDGELGPGGLIDLSDELPPTEIKPVISKK